MVASLGSGRFTSRVPEKRLAFILVILVARRYLALALVDEPRRTLRLALVRGPRSKRRSP